MQNQLISELQQISSSLQQFNEYLLYISNGAETYTTTIANNAELHKQIIAEQTNNNSTQTENQMNTIDLETSLKQIQQTHFEHDQLKQRVTNLKSYLNYLFIKMNEFDQVLDTSYIETVKQNNDIVLLLKDLNEMNMKDTTPMNENETIENKQNELYSQRKNELKTQLIQFNLPIKEIMTQKQIKQIEKWTEQRMEQVLFDSQYDNWNQNTSIFDQKIFGKSNIVIAIQLENGDVIGGYISQCIDKYNFYIEDVNAFLFKFSRFEIKQFYIEECKNACGLFPPDLENLFVFGESDIVIRKHDFQNQSYCQPKSFDMYGTSLVPDQYFVPQRFMVIQMYQSEIMKHRTEMKRQILSKIENVLTLKQMRICETWTQKQCECVVFDSFNCLEKKVPKTMKRNIFGKSHLLMIFDTEDGTKIGCYIDTEINKVNEGIVDPNAFIFTMRNNNFQRFFIKEEKKNEKIFLFSDDKKRFSIMKIGKHDLNIVGSDYHSCCYQDEKSSFDYRGTEKVLLNKIGWDCFSTKRIIVIQMN